MSFSLGQTIATRGVHEVMESDGIFAVAVRAAFLRHAACDWGEMCDEDREANDRALASGDRLHSSYKIADRRVWIITEADRSATTVLFPCEY